MCYGFCAISFVVDQPIWNYNTMIIGTKERLEMVWGIVAVPFFKQKTLTCQNAERLLCFCLFLIMGENMFYFHLTLFERGPFCTPVKHII
jgi:hypothetical protein